jgi:DNA polymerase III subunit gamma/tau
VSLYRTWRPLSFADLVGQDAVVRTLTAAIEGGKLAHAYLFSGPRGSGKTSAAKILARCINCVNGPTATPDNTCENCLAMIAGNALDVLEIDAASNRGIDEIRALRDAVKFAPAAMRMKVYIIDEAHMLTKEGANAFLKTLEEPPAHAVFILATTEPERLPLTVLSRCQRYAFRRIAIPVMIERLQEIARAEGIVAEPAALAAIAYRADGGLRDALTMLEQAAAFSGGETLAVATLDLAFGATGRDVANRLLDATIARDPAAALATIEEASDAGTDILILIRSLVAAFRNLLVARVDPDLLARDLAPEDAQRARERARGVSMPVLVRTLRGLTESLSLARTGGNPRLELETTLLRLILAAEDTSLDGLAARVATIEERLKAPVEPALSAPTPAPASSAAAADAPAPAARLSLNKVRAAWPSVSSKAASEYHPLKGALSGATIEEIDGNAVVLSARSAVDAAVVRERVALIEAAAADVLGARVRIAVRVGGGAAKAKGTAPGGVASVTADGAHDDAEALFNYASERIRER